MTHIAPLEVAEFAGLTHEIQRMLYGGQLSFELVKFQLGRLTQKSMQGIVGQVPTFKQVRAPGSLQPTIDRLREQGWLSSKIPVEVIQQALQSCAGVPSGTLLDVVKLPLWMLGEHFTETREVFKAAKSNRLSDEHNSWLPFAIIDQFRHSDGGNAEFLLKGFGGFKKMALVASPGSNPRLRIEWPTRWFYYSGTEYCFVREA
jgi:hypothetical protein